MVILLDSFWGILSLTECCYLMLIHGLWSLLSFHVGVGRKGLGQWERGGPIVANNKPKLSVDVAPHFQPEEGEIFDFLA